MSDLLPNFSCHERTPAIFHSVSSTISRPIAGTDNNLPILTCNELCEEGRSQKNCVGGYASRIRKGGIFVYRVAKPERATLSTIKTPEGDWIIKELKCCANAGASVATQQAVQGRLDLYGIHPTCSSVCQKDLIYCK